MRRGKVLQTSKLAKQLSRKTVVIQAGEKPIGHELNNCQNRASAPVQSDSMAKADSGFRVKLRATGSLLNESPPTPIQR